MEKLVILDYTTGKVHIYNYDRDEDCTDEYISSLGYSANNCNYMVGNLEILKHKGILK